MTGLETMLANVTDIMRERGAKRKFAKFTCEASSLYEARRNAELKSRFSMEKGLILECGVTTQDCIDHQQPKQPAQPTTPKKGESVTFKVSNASKTRRSLELEIRY